MKCVGQGVRTRILLSNRLECKLLHSRRAEYMPRPPSAGQSPTQRGCYQLAVGNLAPFGSSTSCGRVRETESRRENGPAEAWCTTYSEKAPHNDDVILFCVAHVGVVDCSLASSYLRRKLESRRSRREKDVCRTWQRQWVWNTRPRDGGGGGGDIDGVADQA